MSYDVAVIGKGLIGTAAARYLAAAGADVVVIGPDEPAGFYGDDPHAVYASHYDQGRIAMRLHRDLIWHQLATESMAAYPGLEEAGGVRFFYPRGGLFGAAPGRSNGRLDNAAAVSATAGLQFTPLDAAAAAQRFPMLRFPSGGQLLYEERPAGFINPRDLVRAQLAAGGVTHLPRVALRVVTAAQGVEVTLDDGSRVSAGQALVAAGPYTNSHRLLPRRLALRVKSETIIFARLAPEADPLADMPVVSFAVNHPTLSDIYLLPPIRYPDGHVYVKMGANTIYDETLSDRRARNRWFEAGAGALSHAPLRAVLQGLLPELPAVGWHTGRCLITYTSHGKPMIDAVANRLFVAVGGNGTGAHLSDAVGRLAADRVRGRWTSTLPQERFRARFGDEVGWGMWARKAAP